MAAQPLPRFGGPLAIFPQAHILGQGAATAANAARSPVGSPGTAARMFADLWGEIHKGTIPADDDAAIELAIKANEWAQHNKEAGNAVRRRDALSNHMAARYKNHLTGLLERCCKGLENRKLTPAEFAEKRKTAFEQTYFNRKFAEFHDGNGIPTSRPVWISLDLPEFQLCDPEWEFASKVPCSGRPKSRGGRRSTRRSKKSKRSTRRRAY